MIDWQGEQMGIAKIKTLPKMDKRSRRSAGYLSLIVGLPINTTYLSNTNTVSSSSLRLFES